MYEPAQKCEYNAIFKQKNTLKLFIAFKMAYSCCFSFGGNLHFPEFLQKKFYNINYRDGLEQKKKCQMAGRWCLKFTFKLN